MNLLVSVIIAAYNSSTFIEETLESIKDQTWQELELIIADDCSADDTVEVCQNWLSNNSQYFVRTELITVTKNTGVSANANRGLRAAKGAWIKLLGADDKLLPNCIGDNVRYISEHQEIKVLFSKVLVYWNAFEEENFLGTIPAGLINDSSILWPGRSAESQYNMLLLSDRIHFSPSVFMNRETLMSIGGCDERFPMIEDYPLWLNLTKSGNRLFFMDKPTVKYRQHSGAVNNTGIEFLIRPGYFKSEELRRIYTYPNLPWDLRMDLKWKWYTSQIFRIERFNNKTKASKLLLTFLTIYLNPFRYYLYLKKRFLKNLKNEELYYY